MRTGGDEHMITTRAKLSKDIDICCYIISQHIKVWICVRWNKKLTSPHETMNCCTTWDLRHFEVWELSVNLGHCKL